MLIRDGPIRTETAGTAPSQLTDADLPTVDAIVEEKRRQAAEHAAARKAAQAAAKKDATPATPSESVEEQTTKAEAQAEAIPEGKSKPKSESSEGAIPEAGASPEALQQEADAQGAFNPETGEINWDCPCLGGMAHGPCGEEFKEAFSCFVYSKEEPKGMDCIDKFSYVPELSADVLVQPEFGGTLRANHLTVTCRTASASTPRSTAPS